MKTHEDTAGIWLLHPGAVTVGPVWADDANAPKEEEDPNEREKREREEREAKKPGALQIPDPGTEGRGKRRSRGSRVARFQKAWKANKKNSEELIKAIDAPRASGTTPRSSRSSSRSIVSHKDHTVAVAAVVAVARQTTSPKKAPSTLMRALKKEKRTRGHLRGSRWGSASLGYQEGKTRSSSRRKHHRKDTSEKPQGRGALLRLHQVQGRRSVCLAEHLDEPYPENVNSPSNPPASWWEERFKEWQSNVPFTRWAIAQLVEGETFESESEAKQWAESEGGKHGIAWER